MTSLRDESNRIICLDDNAVVLLNIWTKTKKQTKKTTKKNKTMGTSKIGQNALPVSYFRDSWDVQTWRVMLQGDNYLLSVWMRFLLKSLHYYEFRYLRISGSSWDFCWVVGFSLLAVHTLNHATELRGVRAVYCNSMYRPVTNVIKRVVIDHWCL